MKVKNVLAFAFTSALLVACSNDEVPQDGAGMGEKAWIGLNISLPTLTRAADASDSNAEDVETDIKTISIYMNGPGFSQELEKLTEIDKNKFEWDAAAKKWTMSQAIEVEGGTTQRQVYVVVNEPAAPALDAASLKAGGVYAATIKELTSASTGFAMFNAAPVTAKLYADPDEAKNNPTNVSVARAAAKVLVTASDGGINPDADFADKNATGKFSGNSLMWLIGNSNKKIFPLPDLHSKDPNWDKLTDANGWKNLADEYEQLTNPTYSMAVPAFDSSIKTGYEGGLHVQYCNENTNEVYQVGNTTYISLQVEFTPDLVVVESDITASGLAGIGTPTTAGTKGETFYYHMASQKYFNEAAYVAYTTTHGGAKDEFFGAYDKGICYYYIPIRNGSLPTSEMGVLRNTYYTARIKSLVAPGNPTPITPDPTDPENPDPDGPDPTVPIDQPLNVAFTIEVAAWNPVSMGDLDVQ